jgi:hypothetical protein
MKFYIEDTDTNHFIDSQIVIAPENFNYSSCITYIFLSKKETTKGLRKLYNEELHNCILHDTLNCLKLSYQKSVIEWTCSKHEEGEMHTEFLLETVNKRQPLVTARYSWVDKI